MQLQDPIEKQFRLVETQKRALKKLGLETIEDLLYHFPTRYGDTSAVQNIQTLEKGTVTVIFGKIKNLKTEKAFRSKIPMAKATIEDETGSIGVVWFNQPYLAKMISPETFVRAEGKVSQRKDGNLYLSNPKIESVTKLPLGVGDSLFGKEGEPHSLYPIYSESRGVTSNWFYHALSKIFKSGILENAPDPIPNAILEKYHLPSFKTALIWIHAPKKTDDALSARKRFAFEEVFFIQLEKQRAKREWQKNKSFVIEKSPEELAKFVSRFPFTPTLAQQRAIEIILTDFKKGFAMSRLLEGDVGSGKTAVAATSVFAITGSRPSGQNFGALQTAYMCPTEILATQHFESFIKYFSHLPIQIALITSSGCRKFPSKVSASWQTGGWTNISRNQLLKWVANGEIPILIGTHSLIQKAVKFKNLAYVIIDEQHRFGVSQRQALARGKSYADKTQIHADTKTTLGETGLLYKDLTYKIGEALFRVANTLGLGHKEVVYQRALAEEFTRIDLQFNREKHIPISYNKKKVGVYVPDFVVEEKIIVELKALPFVASQEKKQLWNYLKGSDYKLALLVNFSPPKLDIHRVIYEKARASAFHPQESALNPHLLSMTATPIPRTLALTIYGDLDLTLLDEMPAGRKPIITEIVLPGKREEVYKKIRRELKAGRQLYVICPRIDVPDPAKEAALVAKSVKEEAARLKKSIFPEYPIGILHSKMNPAKKDEAMQDFKSGKTKILCATSVVEVGVNVPNATVIIIEGAERFGLAQLHQLRGRVIRSTDQAYCYVFAEAKTPKTLDRLKALQKAKNGFELAEFDLQFRGAGELYSGKQWGISDIAMEALKNLKMVEAGRAEAREILETDSELSKYPELKNTLDQRIGKEIHFE